MWLGKYLTLYWILSSVRALLEKSPDLNSRPKRLLSYNLICPPGCDTCSPVSGCVTCMTDLYLILHRDGTRQTGMCVPSCPKGYYGIRHRKYNRCYKCTLDNCESCISSSQCVSCTVPYIAFKGQCMNKCPEGLFYETYTQSCLPKVDCAVGEWMEWGICTKNGQHCGYKYGVQTRKRQAIQNPSPNGLACPALNEYKACRIQYRYCSDIATNKSDMTQTPFYPTRRHKNIKHRLYLKKKKRERRRRKKCKSKGRIWRHGFCLKKRRRRNNNNNNNANDNNNNSELEKIIENNLNTIDYIPIVSNRRNQLPEGDFKNEWENSLDNNEVMSQ